MVFRGTRRDGSRRHRRPGQPRPGRGVSIPYVYDVGALIAVDSNDRRMWTIHHLAIEEGRSLLVPAPVVGQA